MDKHVPCRNRKDNKIPFYVNMKKIYGYFGIWFCLVLWVPIALLLEDDAILAKMSIPRDGGVGDPWKPP